MNDIATAYMNHSVMYLLIKTQNMTDEKILHIISLMARWIFISVFKN